MGHSLSANKRERQNERRRIRNKLVKITLRKELKAFDASVSEKGADLKASFDKVQSALDTAVKKNVIPKGLANRKKSRLAKQIAQKQKTKTATAS